MRHKEVFNQLLRETALFKIELVLSEDLQRRLEFIEWHFKVKKVSDLLKNHTPTSDDQVMEEEPNPKTPEVAADFIEASFEGNISEKKVDDAV